MTNNHGRLDRDSWVVLKNKKAMGDVLPAHRIQQRATAGIQAIFQKTSSTLELLYTLWLWLCLPVSCRHCRPWTVGRQSSTNHPKVTRAKKWDQLPLQNPKTMLQPSPLSLKRRYDSFLITVASNSIVQGGRRWGGSGTKVFGERRTKSGLSWEAPSGGRSARSQEWQRGDEEKSMNLN